MIDGNEPAFPCQDYANGMDLRTWLAGLAMQGILASDQNQTVSRELIAEWAVDHADAVLAALNKRAAQAGGGTREGAVSGTEPRPGS